jgi:hypothetical protein
MSSKYKKIFDAIEIYSKAYEELEKIQDEENGKPLNEKIIPKGDQKTGAIGEFYALLYARQKYSDKTVELAPMGSRFDIIVAEGNEKIQVKTISEYSKNKTTTLKGYADNIEFTLYLIYLDKSFKPTMFWEIPYETPKKKEILKLESVRKKFEHCFKTEFIRLIENSRTS